MNNLTKELDILIKDCEEIAGFWNGEDPGNGEERANIALDIIEKAKQLKELISYINE